MADETGDSMHPTARRCVWAAVLLWVAGAALVGLAPTLYGLADGWLGGAVEIAVGFLQEALVPTGAALVGAAVVVQALRGARPSSGAEDPSGPETSGQVATTAGPPPLSAPTPRPALSASAPSVPVPSAPAPSRPVSLSPVPPPAPAAPAPPLSGAVPVPSSPVLAAAPRSGPVLAAPVLEDASAPESGAQVAVESPARGGRRSRPRRNH